MSGDILSDFERYAALHEERWRSMSLPMLCDELRMVRSEWRRAWHGGQGTRQKRVALSTHCHALRDELRARCARRKRPEARA